MNILTVIFLGSPEAVAVHRVHAQIAASVSGAKNTVCFVSGAGCSVESEFPTGTEFVYLKSDKRAVTKGHRLSKLLKRKRLEKKLGVLINKHDYVISDGFSVSGIIAESIIEHDKKCLTILHGTVSRVRPYIKRVWNLLLDSRFIYCGVSESVTASLLVTTSIRSDNAVSVVNGVDVETVKTGLLDRASARSFLGLRSDDFVVGVTARLENQKNIERLLDCFHIYAAKDVDARLVIIGAGSLGEKLKKKAIELNLEEQVIFSGYLENGYCYLKAFDIYGLLSFAEGFALSVLEAQVAQLPIILSNIEPFKEVEKRTNSSFCKVINTNLEFAEVISEWKNIVGSKTPFELEGLCLKRMRREYSSLIQKHSTKIG